MADGGVVERCLNCGKLHDTGDCDYPSFMHSCSSCNIISIDGDQHDPPCNPKNGKSSFRRNIYSVKPIELFRMRLTNKNEWFYVLDAESGKMKMAHDDLIMQSPGTEATFRFEFKPNSSPTVICTATALKRFAVLLATPIQSAWRFRARIIPTNDTGLLCFPMRKAIPSVQGKLVVPDDFKYNAAIIIGIWRANPKSKVQFKVFASIDGKSTENPFNGYFGSLTFDEKGETTISESVTREGATNRLFPIDLAKLYVSNIAVADLRKENELFQMQMKQDRIKIEQLQLALAKAALSVSTIYSKYSIRRNFFLN